MPPALQPQVLLQERTGSLPLPVSFSNEARKYAEEKASKKIVLIDGEELARYMIEYNIGVSTKHIYKIKRIDTDYFDDSENGI